MDAPLIPLAGPASFERVVEPPVNSSPLRLDVVESGRRRWLIARTFGVSVGALAVMLAVFYLAPWDGSAVGSVTLRIALALSIVVIVTVLAVQSLGRAEYPLLRLVEALAIVVGLMVISFASAYVLLSEGDAAAFTEPLGRTDALYFSLTTATTVGFGDISAKSEPARIAVMAQMVTNVVVLGVAARVLVHAARRRSGP